MKVGLGALTANGVSPGYPILWKQYATYIPTAASTTHTITFTTTPTTGNMLILVATADSTITTPTGWTRDVTLVASCETSIYRKISAGTETNVAVTIASSTTMVMAIFEFVGYAGTLDASSSGSGASQAYTISCGTTGATTATNDLAIAMVGVDVQPAGPNARGRVVSWTNNFQTLLWIYSTRPSPTINTEMAIAIMKRPTTGTVTTTATMLSSQNFAGTTSNGLIACYK
jgi:hypothetical protein